MHFCSALIFFYPFIFTFSRMFPMSFAIFRNASYAKRVFF